MLTNGGVPSVCGGQSSSDADGQGGGIPLATYEESGRGRVRGQSDTRVSDAANVTGYEYLCDLLRKDDQSSEIYSVEVG